MAEKGDLWPWSVLVSLVKVFRELGARAVILLVQTRSLRDKRAAEARRSAFSESRVKVEGLADRGLSSWSKFGAPPGNRSEIENTEIVSRVLIADDSKLGRSAGCIAARSIFEETFAASFTARVLRWASANGVALLGILRLGLASVRTEISIPRERLEEFCRRWKIAGLRVFGSALRDDFGRDSDLDLLVSFAPDADWSLMDHVAMEEELAGIVGRKVDLVSQRAIERSSNWIRRKAILESAEPYFARDDAHLLDILKAARLAIEFKGPAEKAEFLEDAKTQLAVLHQLLMIGEAVKRMSPEFRAAHPEVPWRLIAGTRDKLIRFYEGVDLEEVWRMATSDLPDLISRIELLVPEIS